MHYHLLIDETRYLRFLFIPCFERGRFVLLNPGLGYEVGEKYGSWIARRLEMLGLWDRPFHRRTALLMEEEARVSRAAWAQSMDACDQYIPRAYHFTYELRSSESRPCGDRDKLVETLNILKSLKDSDVELAETAWTALRIATDGHS
ncbi:hypothetical protein Tco_1113051 [Tanacetum coccineum]|uniref:Uncharacterized protein n=1 Tax=Tanacetum coccineum TaxID=301880 RepID=A0ABQ5ITT7_9ASTR